jgi:hypothetical protein
MVAPWLTQDCNTRRPQPSTSRVSTVAVQRFCNALPPVPTRTLLYRAFRKIIHFVAVVPDRSFRCVPPHSREFGGKSGGIFETSGAWGHHKSSGFDRSEAPRQRSDSPGELSYSGHIRAVAGLDDVRIHNARHSFASIAVSGGDSLCLYVGSG